MPEPAPARVYDGLTDHVTPAGEAERIRRTLYRTDASARAAVLPAWRSRLDEADLRRFREEGYLAVEGLLPPPEVAACAEALDDLARRGAADGSFGLQEEPYYQRQEQERRRQEQEPQQRSPQPTLQGGVSADDPVLRVRKLWRFVGVEPRLAAAVASPRIAGILDQLIGPGARLIQDMALLKPPHLGAEKPWHQDNAYFDWTPLDGVLGVWIALDPATVENGCMQIVPGSHREGPVPHHHARDCQLVDRQDRVDRAQVVPLGPGGALFFSALLHHGTPPNRTGDRRRALQFHYAAASCRRMTFREHMANFDVGGAYAGCRDWDLEAGISRAVLVP